MRRSVSEIVDSHHHLWRLPDIAPEGILASRYLQRDFLWPDFTDAWDGLPVLASVFVQVRSDFEEVGFVESVAAENTALRAMIAWAPLERPGVRTDLSRLRRQRLVRGVRRNTQHEADRLFCARADFVAGARLLGELGYLCEVCVRYEQLEGALQLARACPETTVVLEHLGKPDVSSVPPAYWLRGMEDLAAQPNVICKVSVVVHSDADPAYRAEALAPFVQHAVSCFGWERVLFGSNWPVSQAVISYRAWVEMLKDILASASDTQAGGFFAGNARRIYSLE